MANNEQNTYSGGAGAIAPASGNSALDKFLKIASVGVDVLSTGYGIYQDKEDRSLAREIEKINATKAPIQAMPASKATSPADYLSDPQSMQSLIFYGVSFIVIGGLSIWALKKL